MSRDSLWSGDTWGILLGDSLDKSILSEELLKIVELGVFIGVAVGTWLMMETCLLEKWLSMVEGSTIR